MNNKNDISLIYALDTLLKVQTHISYMHTLLNDVCNKELGRSFYELNSEEAMLFIYSYPDVKNKVWMALDHCHEAKDAAEEVEEILDQLRESLEPNVA